MRKELLIPTTSGTLDWPRRVANAVKYLLTVAETPIASPFVSLAAAPASPTEGQTYYDTVLHKARVWDGTTWNNLW